MTALTDGDGKPFTAGLLLREENPIIACHPAGEILMSLDSNREKIDCEVTIEDVLQDEVGRISVNNQHKNDEVDSSLTRAVPPQVEDDFKYNMDHKHRGCFIIFNQEHFDPILGLESRTGTKKDAYNMYLIAAKLGFDYVNTFYDLTRSEILSFVQKVSEGDHSMYDAFGFAILTHGEEDGILYAKDAPFNLSECKNLFTADKCPSLAQKPKIFFIQACRGTKSDAGSKIPNSLRLLSNPMREKMITIPNQADFLVAYSTIPGYMSWRNKANGSWFVQALYNCIITYGQQLELMQIMTRVNREVAVYFESNTNGDLDGCKQIPSITSQLTANVFFHKKGLEAYSCPLCLKVDNEKKIASAMNSPQSPDIEQADKRSENKRRSSVGTWLRKSLRRKRK